VSWQLVSFLIVGGIIVAGFAWYERSRPPAQVVALVAALAALAIAGRIAFAAFPNVKPTTDIVIFAGFALGGAPGFAVGALTALVSNFWFGQGPWTPWQMVAWGLCGILGALLARVIPRPNRWVLAAVCGFAGAAYGALLNFSLMATYGGELSLARFGVLEARAIPFDAAHVAANVVLALVAGPAMLRMLVRFRERFEWTRREGEPAAGGEGGRPLGPVLRGGGVATLLLVLAALTATTPSARADSPENAVAWLVSVQNKDGGWGSSPGDGSDPTMTCWSMLGLEAAGRNPLDVAYGGSTTPVDYLRSKVSAMKSPGTLSLGILALEGAGVDPHDFGGRNLVEALAKRARADGSYEGWAGATSYAVLAFRSVGADGATGGPTAWLRETQNPDGGWGDVPGSPSTADGTGAAMMALAGSKAAQRGIAYLKSHQRQNGGFAIGSSGTVNSQSTAWAVQGILAAGGDPAGLKKDGNSPLDYLASNQQPDGSYSYATAGGGTSKLVAEQTPVWSTAQVLAAVTESTYPIASVPRAPKPKTPPAESAPTRSSSSGGAPPAEFAPEPAPEVPPPESSTAIPEEMPSSVTGGSESGKQGKGKGKSKGGKRSSGKGPGASSEGGVPPTPTDGGQPLEPGAEAGGATATAEPSSEADSSDGGGSGGVAGAILAGALAGCLIFGGGWLAKRGWMHWRYGL
jgi:energy-coupling factor transport system substrate-specific component